MNDKKRKHRVVVEITMKYACTEKQAVAALKDDLIYVLDVSNPIERYHFKAFSKVLSGLTKASSSGHILKDDWFTPATDMVKP